MFRPMLLALALSLALVPGVASAQLVGPITFNAPIVSVPITGIDNSGDFFSGNFVVDRFFTNNGQMFAVGAVQGVVTNTQTGATRSVSGPATLPVQNVVTQQVPPGACRILQLSFGPDATIDLPPFFIVLDPATVTVYAYGPLSTLICLFFPPA